LVEADAVVAGEACWACGFFSVLDIKNQELLGFFPEGDMGGGRERHTGITRRRNPFDPHAIAEFDRARLGARAELHDFADALVAADLAWLGRVGETCPAVCLWVFLNVKTTFILIPSGKEEVGAGL
jgi:hypothetical protein